MSGRGGRARALALAALAFVTCGPRAAAAPVAPGEVVLVLDRSASLRHADPDARGPRVLAMTLALAAPEGQRVSIVTTDGADVGPVTADGGADPAAFLRRLDAALSQAPRTTGGADLAVALGAAFLRAGADGLVILYTDDDLDVVGADGRAPRAALERARRGSPRPARDDVNRAAAALLVEGLPAARAALVGLRAPLPSRAVPILERLGATIVDLRPETSDGDVVGRLATALAGEALVLRGDALERPLDLPWPARVGILAARPAQVPGGLQLDGGGRLWLVDAPAGPLAALPGATAILLPRVEVPAEVRAWALQGGGVRVSAIEPASPPGCGLAARAGAAEVALTAAGPAAPEVLHGELWPAEGLTEVEVVRVVVREGNRVVTGRRRVPVTRAEVVLTPRGPARAWGALELAGPLPPGFVPRRTLALRVHQAGGEGGAGSSQVVPLEVRGDELVARVVPQRAGALDVTAEGELAVRLAAPLEVGREVERALVIEQVTAAWAGRPAALLEPGEPIDVTRGDVRLEVSLRLDPPAGGPIPLAAALEGAPAEVGLSGPAQATIMDRATLSLALRWPRTLGDAALMLRVRAGEGEGVSAGRALGLDAGASWGRRALAAAIVSGSLLWFVLLVRRRRRLLRTAVATMGDKQLRAVGENGRLTFERYKLLEHSQEDLSSLILPEDSQASIALSVREDGTVHVRALDGAQLVHEDRPTLLAAEAVLRHGTAFAVVHERKARRYVYLDREPDAEDLARRYVDAVSIGEGEVRDSGVFVILDDDQNLASADAVPATAAMFSASRDRVGDAPDADEAAPDDDDGPDDDGASDEGSDDLFEDSRDEVLTIPDEPPGRPRLLSDEGIVIMDSTEASIMDRDEVDTLPDEETAR